MQQGGGGSQYGVSPEMPQYAAAAATAAATGRTHLLGISSSEQLQLQQQQHMIQKSSGDPATLAEAASPISSRPPPRNLDELPPGASSFADEEALAGEESERGPPGNRWPRQETLALLKIRSEMDAAFRDATLKGPLWEDVSRKLAELGYIRNAKKCKEKFENVHKYYKRTKEGRAGRQDGKSYRFFSQLEALHSSAGGGGGGGGAITMLPSTTGLMATSSNPLAATPISVGIAAGINPMIGSSGRVQPTPVSSAPPSQIGMQRIVHDSPVGAATGGASGSVRTAGISFSSNSSSSNDDSDEDMDEGGPSSETRKRKRSESEGPSQKMMIFFEGLMKQVMERQEAMQQRFLETIEKREQDKMIREEAWRRQEMARLSREHELMAQERAMAASRDAAVIAFLQKITGQNLQMQPAAVAIPAVPPQQTAPPPAAAAAAPAQQQHHIHHAPPTQPTPQPQPQSQLPLQQQSQSLPQSQSSKIMPQQQPQSQSSEIAPHHPPSPPKDMMVVHVQQPHHQPQYQQPQEIVAATSFDPTSSRWPKTEVLALIKLRSGLESRYQEAGPKGPLWEEISAGMQRMGYNRSAKRCKEKWENINKYFKKVKESNKKRPEDAKTCPYFHQLDALYRRKMVGGGSSSGAATQTRQDQEIDTANEPSPLAIMPPSMAQPTNLTENKSGGSGEGKDGDGSNLQVPTSNGGLPPSFFEEGSLKKPEDIVKELMEQHQHQSVMDDYDKLEAADSDNMDQEEDDEDDDDDDDGEHEEESKMDYKIQFQRQNASSSKGEGNVGATKATVSPFLAMVQ